MANELYPVAAADEFHSDAAEFASALTSLRIASAAKPRKSKNIMKQAAKFAALAGAGVAVAVATGTTKINCTINTAPTTASVLVQVSKDVKDTTNPDVTYTLYESDETVAAHGTLKKGLAKQTLRFEGLAPGSAYTLRFTILHEGATRVVGRSAFRTRTLTSAPPGETPVQ